MVEEPKEESRNGPLSAASEAGESEDSGLDQALPEECADLLKQKDDEAKQLHDRVLRLAAEMENTRKRLEREKSDGIQYANENLIRDLLPVIDNLERALQHGENLADPDSLQEGVRMTLKAFQDVLARYGCAPFEAVGRPFDPNFHEALMQQETLEYPDKTVLQEFHKGYTLRDRLLRPASVIVAKEPADES